MKIKREIKKTMKEKKVNAMKKLIPALCLLLISAALLGTATYAWFSMNTTVSVTGMQITAQSNNTYLLIAEGEKNAAQVQASPAITVTYTSTDAANIFPSKPLVDSEIGHVDGDESQVAAGKLFATGTPVTNKTTAAAPANWYTANSNNPQYSTSDGTNSTVTNATKLTTFDGYVVKKTYTLALAAGSKGANNLTVKPTITAAVEGKTIDAVKILVATSDGGFTTLTTATNSAVDIKGSNTTLTDSNVITVDVYIYYDGSVDSVNTNNAANLSGATISLEFNVSAVTE